MASTEAEPVGSRGEKDAAATAGDIETIAGTGPASAGPDAPRDNDAAVTGDRGQCGAAATQPSGLALLALGAGGIIERRRRANAA